MPSRKEYTGISNKVRKRVVDRDRKEGYPCCIYCGRPARTEDGQGIELHHYIPRSLGGRGIEKNLVCLCSICHKQVHGGEEYIKEFIKEYLSFKYEDWDEDKLVWRK